ncbi:glycosyltransferase family 4 protein [Pyrococcus kukulkanii]|uniref:glycosyltransferase family 4 protein n=1 Tax=Pyrococcus kukulkanii TaxID=1609559 RepID=UPI003565897D
MRVMIIGESRKKLNEGYTKIAYSLKEHIKKAEHDVVLVSRKDVLKPKFFQFYKKFNPDIVHYITAPTLSSLLVLKLIKSLDPEVKVVASALHPYSLKLFGNNSSLRRKILEKVRPDLMLIQTKRLEALLTRLSIPYAYLPNGVDIDVFMPVSKKKKKELREKYGISPEKTVILHVGHIKPERNLHTLIDIKKLLKDSVEGLVVASDYFGVNKEIYHSLLKNNIKIITKYIPNIEEVYQLADIYIFPTRKEGSIFMPLSVLEAMACNLPVITTPFDGLLTYFKEGNGIFYADSPENFLLFVKQLLENNIDVKTRDFVIKYSWDNVITRLLNLYKNLLE